MFIVKYRHIQIHESKLVDDESAGQRFITKHRSCDDGWRITTNRVFQIRNTQSNINQIFQHSLRIGIKQRRITRVALNIKTDGSAYSMKRCNRKNFILPADPVPDRRKIIRDESSKMMRIP